LKPILFHNPKTQKESFYVQEDHVPRFYDTLHYHPEYQLTVIINATGNILLGDSTGRFKSNEVYFISPNLSHVFRCDKEYYYPKSKLMAHGISIYFNAEVFPLAFLELPENNGIKLLLSGKQRGVKIEGESAERIANCIYEIKASNGLKRLTSLLHCLDKISKIKNDKTILCSTEFSLSSEQDHDRMNLVFKYIMNHFHENITLAAVSEIACLTPTAFCRFFKRKTRKTFVEFLSETRIGYACKLLAQNKFSILEISDMSGYKNISNFNRQFKKFAKCTPSEYMRIMQR
jgi:AraC-like DNA-binding protein